MVRRRTLNHDDRVAWSKVAATVKPRPGRSAYKQDLPLKAAAMPVGPSAKSAHASGAWKTAARPGVAAPQISQRIEAPADRSHEKRVRRGKVVIHGRIDLHGLTLVQAEQALRAFLFEAAGRGARCVLVITGKGAPAAGHRVRAMGEHAPGVIRRSVPAWLSAHDVAPLLAGRAPAHASHGGEGALYVFLKRL